MNYCMSDIHGNYKAYKKMLKKICFSDNDTLYILGDVIDRGPDGMKILQDMMMRSNIIPIIGNHEYMALLALPWLLSEISEENVKKIDEDTLQTLTEWMNVGGEVSIAEFNKLRQEEREAIGDYLEEFSLYEVVEAGGKTFVLVHAGLDNFLPQRELDHYELNEMIFHKPDYERVYFEDKYLVTGHTPVRVVHAEEQGLLLEEVKEGSCQDEIFIKNNHIAIDCGSGYGNRLGCICLDTLKTFYV